MLKRGCVQNDLVILDQRICEQLLAHRLELADILYVQFHEPADVNIRDALKAESRQRALDRLTLRVQDARLRTDQDTGPHAVLSSHA